MNFNISPLNFEINDNIEFLVNTNILNYFYLMKFSICKESNNF